jgi:hypothetical protein
MPGKRHAIKGSMTHQQGLVRAQRLATAQLDQGPQPSDGIQCPAGLLIAHRSLNKNTNNKIDAILPHLQLKVQHSSQPHL